MPKRTLADVERERQLQRQRAWKRSAEVRAENKLVRLMIKDELIDGYDLIASRLEMPDPKVAEQLETIVSRWRVDKLVRAVPGMGPSRTQEVLAIFAVSPRQRVGALSMERRLELSKLVRAAVEIV